MIQEFSDWLATTQLSQAFADAGWFVPAVQTVHILAIAVVVTLLSVLNFRLLRLTRTGPALGDMAVGFIPRVWWAVAILLVSGTLLTITEPSRELLNNAFRLKMLMVVLLVGLTFVLQRSLRRDPNYWTATSGRRALGATVAVSSTVLCVSIVAAGRLIAYV